MVLPRNALTSGADNASNAKEPATPCRENDRGKVGLAIVPCLDICDLKYGKMEKPAREKKGGRRCSKPKIS
jgi:hypothetical protein